MNERWAKGFVAMACVFTVLNASARDFESVAIEPTPLGGGITMLRGEGGNLVVSLGSDGVLLVDTQYAPLSEKILAAIRTLGGAAPRFVIDTHWHEDHTGGNQAMGRGGAILMAHDSVRTRMSSEQFIKAFMQKTPPSPPDARPVVTYSETMTIHWNGQEIHAFHVPRAHTDGDTILHFRGSDVLHMGDTFFVGSYPFIDIWTGGSLEGMIAAVARALAIAGPNTKIVPGHGSLATRKDLVAYHSMLTTVRDRLKGFIAQKLDEEAVLARQPAKEFEGRYGGGAFDADSFVRISYRSLQGTE